MYFGPVRKVSEIPPRGVRTTHYAWNRRFCQTTIPGVSDLIFDVVGNFRDDRPPAQLGCSKFRFVMKLQSPGNGEVSMTRKDFRRLALSFPETTENEHMDHPDFRVRGKIFATFGYPDERWGMVKLMPDQQVDLANAEPDVFVPVKGAWGRRGATSVLLRSAKLASLKRALGLAWRNAAPKKLAENLEG
jgi:hypothetical protein